MSAPSWLITVGIVNEMHGAALERWGGVPGVRDPDCVGGKLAAALMADAYRDGGGDDDPEGDESLLMVTSHLAFYLARGHCFADGNKRVAWMTVSYHLARRGLTLDVSDEEAEECFLQVAEGTIDVMTLHEWIAARLVAMPGPEA